MAISPDFSSSSCRQRELHINVERQGLALGAAQERMRRAASLSLGRERMQQAAIYNWENEGGAIDEAH